MRNDHRSTDVRAELIQVEGWDPLGRRVKVVLGVEVGIAKKFVEDTVELVRTRTKGDVDHGRVAAIGRGRAAGLNLEFLNRVDRREKEEITGVVLGTQNTVEHVNR